MLDLLADELDDEPELSRTAGELFMFSLHADLHMEDLWRSSMNIEALKYEAMWTNTSADKYKAWKAQQPARVQLPSGISCCQSSRGRADDQAEEVLSGLVFPSLDQVRQDPRDDAAARAASKSRTKAQAESKKASTRKGSRWEDNGLGDDDCRHALFNAPVFYPW